MPITVNGRTYVRRPEAADPPANDPDLIMEDEDASFDTDDPFRGNQYMFIGPLNGFTIIQFLGQVFFFWGSADDIEYHTEGWAPTKDEVRRRTSAKGWKFDQTRIDALVSSWGDQADSQSLTSDLTSEDPIPSEDGFVPPPTAPDDHEPIDQDDVDVDPVNVHQPKPLAQSKPTPPRTSSQPTATAVSSSTEHGRPSHRPPKKSSHGPRQRLECKYFREQVARLRQGDSVPSELSYEDAFHGIYAVALAINNLQSANHGFAAIDLAATFLTGENWNDERAPAIGPNQPLLLPWSIDGHTILFVSQSIQTSNEYRMFALDSAPWKTNSKQREDAMHDVLLVMAMTAWNQQELSWDDAFWVDCAQQPFKSDAMGI